MGRTKYNKQFKVLAVKLILEDGKKISKSAKELGISASMLARWVYEYETYGEEKAFPGNGNAIVNKDFELKKLNKKINHLKMENQILKKFQAFLKEQK